MSIEKKRATILVVDDQPENIDVLSSILRSDYRVKAATNGEQALLIVHQKGQPDLIMLDVMMPGIDGYEVCKRLKQDEKTSNIPIIFVSALQGEEDKEKAFKSGAVDYLTKPVMPDEVIRRVQAHI